MSVNVYKHSEDKLINVGGGGGSNVNEKELTKAEYDALSEAEKNNGTTYYVKDEGGDAKSVIDDTDMQSTTTTLSAKKISDSFVEIVEGKSLIADSEITRLKSVTNYNDSGIKLDIKQAQQTADTAQSRIDALITQTPSGDEVTDIRVGVNGITYASAGEAVRTQFAKLSPFNILSGVVSEDTKFTQVDKKAWVYNKSTVDGGAYYYRIYTVNSYAEVIVTGHSWGSSYPLVCFYDKDGKYLTYEGNQYNAGDTQYNNKTIKVPSGAVTCYVNGHSGDQVMLASYANTMLEERLSTLVDSPLKHIVAFGTTGESYDANNLPCNSIYRLYTNYNGAELTMKNLPLSISKGIMAVIMTFGNENEAAYKTQIFISDVGDMYFRWSSGTGYTYWTSLRNKNAITINPTDDVIEKFIQAIKQGVTDVYINSGDYDVMELYKKHYGDDFFDTYQGYGSGDNDMGRGIILKNGIHYHFADNAYFHADNTGNTNTNVRTYFSMFATECGKGYIVDGLHITECKNLRYAIHDDFSGGETSNSGIGEYINCHIVCADRCIGAGLHNGSTLKMTDSIFVQTGGGAVVHVHTPNTEGHSGKVIVNGCYFNDKLQVGRGATNTAESTIQVSNCSLKDLVVEEGTPWNLISFNINKHTD